jgi:polar amino acid transport system substrate-binding protein
MVPGFSWRDTCRRLGTRGTGIGGRTATARHRSVDTLREPVRRRGAGVQYGSPQARLRRHRSGSLFEEFPWARAAGLVFRGERDAIFTAFRNDERARFCHFPNEPLARDKWVFFVRAADAGRLKFSSFDDLVGHDIAVLRGASISPEFWDFVHQHRDFTETANDEANFRMLEAGRVDYVVASFANGLRLIGSLGLESKVQPLSSRSLKEDDMYVIFSKERVSPAFVDSFSNALHQFKQTEAFRAIYRKYFPATPYEPAR